MANTVIVIAIVAVLCAVAASPHDPKQSYAYSQGYKTGTMMRERVGLPLTRGSRALITYCRQAPYTADIPSRNAGQWLAGYDAGCDGE